MQTHRVKCLLMGGQACVLYGAAEFSRELDRLYWEPLKQTLQQLRLNRRSDNTSDG